MALIPTFYPITIEMLVATGHSFIYLKVLQLPNFISLYSGLLLFTLYIQRNHPLEVKDSAAHIHLDPAPRDLHMLVNLCYFKMSSVSNNSFGFAFFLPFKKILYRPS